MPSGELLKRKRRSLTSLALISNKIEHWIKNEQCGRQWRKRQLSDQFALLQRLDVPLSAVTRGSEMWEKPLGVLRVETIWALEFGPTLRAPRWRTECPLDMKPFPPNLFLSVLVMQTLPRAKWHVRKFPPKFLKLWETQKHEDVRLPASQWLSIKSKGRYECESECYFLLCTYDLNWLIACGMYFTWTCAKKVVQSKTSHIK